MLYRSFGGHQVQVSRVGLGTAQLNPLSGPKRFSDVAAIVNGCLTRGVTYFDTANSYGAGWSERWLGKALRYHRHEVMIATKFGLPATIGSKIRRRASGSIPLLDRQPKPPDGYGPAHCKAAVEGSLRRLGTDYVDVLMLHSPPATVLRDGEWVDTVSALRARGTIRFYGVSVRNVEDAIFAIRRCGVDAVQVELHACTIAAAGEVLQAARAAGAAVVARQVFRSGGLIQSVAAKLPDCTRLDIASGLLQRILDCTEVSVALIGMRSEAHVAANLGFDGLSSQTDQRVSAAIDEVCASRLGDRIPEDVH